MTAQMIRSSLFDKLLSTNREGFPSATFLA